MRVLQVSAYDEGGGAETVARGLHDAYRRDSLAAWLAVGRRRGDAAIENLIELSPELGRGAWGRACLAVADRIAQAPLRLPGGGLMRLAARPRGSWARWRGREDFDAPGTENLLNVPSAPPDVLQCHNLQGGYFDLTKLSEISQRLPVVLTLHDCWMITGHCAHSFDCRRWETGCGQCPDLTIPPAVRRDATDTNWRRKRDIYRAGRFHVAVPSVWLKEQVMRSMLGAEAIDVRVVPNGIDDRFFDADEDRGAARRDLGLPADAIILLFAANTVRDNIWKDFRTLRAALAQLVGKVGDAPLHLIALGEAAPEEEIGGVRVTFVPYQRDPAVVARYYRAADVYLHASRAETFSLTIAEAMACGLPVVATAVGAVPERVIALDQAGSDQATGILVGSGDAEGFARATASLIGDKELRERLGRNAAAVAQRDYRIGDQARAYRNWFEELLEGRKAA